MCRTIIIAVVFLYQNIIAFYDVAIDKNIREVKLISLVKETVAVAVAVSVTVVVTPTPIQFN